MPTVQHAQPPPEDAPPPSRRDHETPAAGHHGPNDRLRDAWLDELWPTARELPRWERETKRKDDRRKQREMEDRELGIVRPPALPDHSPESPDESTGCAETGSTEMPGSAA